MWAKPVRLGGRLVTLEPLGDEHVGALKAAAADPDVWRWLSTGFDEWLADALGQTEDAVFAVLREGVAVGSTRYLSIAPEHRRLEIGWTWLARKVWGTGVNVEAKLLLLEHAFEELGAVRVEFKTDARNERSRAALAALPAQFEGIFRAHMLVRGGERRDSAYYSVIADEWPLVKARLRARVDAAVARATASSSSGAEP
jgi:RimJ/RimL family protein N-acetyltransferase